MKNNFSSQEKCWNNFAQGLLFKCIQSAKKEKFQLEKIKISIFKNDIAYLESKRIWTFICQTVKNTDELW
jgi:hypothetical protein